MPSEAFEKNQEAAHRDSVNDTPPEIKSAGDLPPDLQGDAPEPQPEAAHTRLQKGLQAPVRRRGVQSSDPHLAHLKAPGSGRPFPSSDDDDEAESDFEANEAKREHSEHQEG